MAGDWLQAEKDGYYRMSTLGASLADIGFIHACLAPQLEFVFERYYQQVEEPILCLEIDPSRLKVSVELAYVDAVDELYPHIMGVLPIDAVVSAHPYTGN